jgi:cytochrome c oxidase cbb3-type subunit I/II
MVVNVGTQAGVGASGGAAVQAGSRVTSDQGEPIAARLESFVYDDAIVRKFLAATLLWGIVAFLVGVLVALQLVAPAAVTYSIGGYKPLFFFQYLMDVEYLSFGRLRPLHTNAAIFAFAGNAIFAGIYYSTQRLCRARMFSDLLSNLHFWGWQAIIVAAAITLPLGFTQGKEYAELEQPIDIAIAVVWLVFFGGNFFGTIIKRRERHMYVALWFYIATIVTVTVLHVFNSLAVSVGVAKLFNGQTPGLLDFFTSYSAYAGVQDAFMQWWYGHNAVAFFLTTPFLGMMYYFMPKAAGRPVYSYRLSIIHFWSLVFIYIWAGPHHLHYTALPAWASTLGMLFSVMLWMPSWGGGINGLMTLRGAWHKLRDDPVLKFFVVGVTFYMMSTFEGPMLSIKTVNALSHYTDWTIAHVHGGALGWNGFLTFGMMYWLLPRLFQTELWSKKLATAHFWIGTIGILMYIGAIYTAGLTQGLMWRAFDATGRLQYPDFVETVVRLVPFYWIRALGGTLFLVGALFAAVNFIMTWWNRPAAYAEPVHTAPALSKFYDDGAPAASRLPAGNIALGHAVDKFLQGRWHRRWERLPVKFTVFVVLAIAVASLFEIVPTFLLRNNVPTIATVKPYSPLELMGREIYISEGCYNCHSQMIRPLWAETKRYGEYSKPGEFVYDHPFQWGSRRIGPDLHREGGKQSHDWHVRHFEDPRQVIPGSLMPSYKHLLDQNIDWDRVQANVDTHAMLGVPYGDTIKKGKAVELAKAQAKKISDELIAQGGYTGLDDKKVIAIIAYLQRIGTDLTAPPDAPPAAAPEGAEASPSTPAPAAGK